MVPIDGASSYWLDRGNSSYLAGSYDMPKNPPAEVVKLDPYLLEGWLNMRDSLFFLGRYQESLNACDAALGLEP